MYIFIYIYTPSFPQEEQQALRFNKKPSPFGLNPAYI